MADAGSVRLSVPGKVILMGEHAAVYGRPAVVAAVDLRLFVEARLGSAGGSTGGRVRLDLPDIGVEKEHSWSAVEEFADRARRRWLAFASGQAPFRAESDGGALVRIAVGEAFTSLERPVLAGLRERDLDLRLRSAIPVGAGFGSSAAAAVGVVAAVRAVAGGSGWAEPDAGQKAGAPSEVSLRDLGEELAAIEAAALEVERRQHGFPSGIDSGTVLRGGVLLVRREGDALRFDDLPQPGWLRREVEIVDSGAPDETTGAVVTTVRRWYEEDPESVSAAFDRIGAATEAFSAALAGASEQDGAAAITAASRALVDLGVVPPAVARRIARVEAAGGAAKISGAGALDGKSAGALICLLGGRRPETVDALADLAPVAARIGADGLRFED